MLTTNMQNIQWTVPVSLWCNSTGLSYINTEQET